MYIDDIRNLCEFTSIDRDFDRFTAGLIFLKINLDVVQMFGLLLRHIKRIV